jgi:hypothetical protein
MYKIRTYYATVFLSAFLLFQIQPLIAKALLPGFGGSYLVWGSCMVFFQGLLVLGYAYVHLIQHYWGPRRYARWHWILLLLPLACLAFNIKAIDVGSAPRPFILELLVLLSLSVGPSFFVLSTTTPLLTRWLSSSAVPQRLDPYVLFSASNLGSLCGLLSYPILTEPLLRLDQQWRGWWGLYLIFVLLQFFCRSRGEAESPSAAASPAALVSAQRGRVRDAPGRHQYDHV